MSRTGERSSRRRLATRGAAGDRIAVALPRAVFLDLPAQLRDLALVLLGRQVSKRRRGVEPGEFFAELYGLSPRAESPEAEIAELSALVDGLANLLVENGRVTAIELARAVAARADKDLLPGAEEAAAKAAENPEARATGVAARTVEASQKP